VLGRTPSHPRGDRAEQDDGPEAEDDLDFADEVQQFGRRLGCGGNPAARRRSSWWCCTECASAATRAAMNVWMMASRNRPVTTALNGSIATREASVSNRLTLAAG
jgi:hypothetical protein